MNAKLVTGRKAAAYKAIFVHCCLLRIIRMIVAANESIIIATETRRSDTPSISFCGRDDLKSCNWNDDVKIDKNVITDVRVNVRERTSLIVNMTKKG